MSRERDFLDGLMYVTKERDAARADADRLAEALRVVHDLEWGSHSGSDGCPRCFVLAAHDAEVAGR